jgi:Predicted membrane protein (DUF2207)
MTSAARLVRGATVIVLAIVGSTVFLAGPAGASSPEAITNYHTAIVVRSDGLLDVTETITYAFGSDAKHGITRQIPIKYHFDSTHDRIYRISRVTVSRDGGPDRAQVSDADGYETIRIGNPNHTITGTHTYVIGYTVAGALNAFSDHVELYWNAIGDEWTVPVGDGSADVAGPSAVQRAQCFDGPSGSTRTCPESTFATNTATFGTPSVGVRSAMTVVVAFPLHAITGTQPILVNRRDISSAFHVSRFTVGGAALVALVSVGVVFGVAWVRGRDRRFAGLLPGLAPAYGEAVPPVQRVPIIGKPPVSVEFTPPNDIRPGQAGALAREGAATVDVVATIVDFAVRKHLRIREVGRVGDKVGDWALEKLGPGDPKFLPYERGLFDALFHRRQTVRLSHLRQTFAAHVAISRRRIDETLIDQGWYTASPDQVRRDARSAGWAWVVAAAVVTFVLGIFTHLALLGLGLVAGAVALIALAGKLPARTGRGSAVFERIKGLRLYIATAEVEQIRFEEREQIFSRYLPYAMAFGLANRWTRVFASISAGGGLYWYVGGPGWNVSTFPNTFGGFADTTTGSITSVAASVGSSGFSGGFSDGGGGGGGGGSW